jgi:DNA-3-methyladenine glycosylase I
MSYCKAIWAMPEGERKQLHQNYHDFLYGFAIDTDDELFGRLILEINQAGLSWETILRKEQAFRAAFDNYAIDKIAKYEAEDINRLLSDAGIIRNRLKINAVIYNAQVILQLQAENGSFKNWLDNNHPKPKEEWVKLFKKHFKFTGGEIVGEFLMSTGYLPGAHDKDCPISHQIQAGKAKK